MIRCRFPQSNLTQSSQFTKTTMGQMPKCDGPQCVFCRGHYHALVHKGVHIKSIISASTFRVRKVMSFGSYQLFWIFDAEFRSVNGNKSGRTTFEESIILCKHLQAIRFPDGTESRIQHMDLNKIDGFLTRWISTVYGIWFSNENHIIIHCYEVCWQPIPYIWICKQA